MRKRQLIYGILALAAGLGAMSPASADPWTPPPGGHTAEEYRRNATHLEMAFLALSAVDTAETIACVHRGRCSEGNPLIGRHPSTSKLIAIRVLADAAHYGVFKYLNHRNGVYSRSWALGGVLLEGAAVGINARFMF